ncbi:MAG TPA: nuclear transport factor 2 family protein [Chitinophagaceae bacterium]|nr:nuclear transport factor 2 family protein [Chitinophagaceae bacterium]
MKSILISGIVLLLTITHTDAQTAEDSVKAVVKQLFDGMKNSDAAMIQSVFADSAILQSIGHDKDGKTVIETDKVEAFAKLISGLKKGAADEQIIFESVKIDLPLAIVWAPYKFYFNGTFSHCGVDSFQLVFINGKWKIQYLIDTRRKQPCN